MKRIVAYSFLAYTITMLVVFAILPTRVISESERRKLAKKPKLTFSAVVDKSYTDNFEKYITDHFPFRDTFRRIKAIWSYNIINQIENNNIYVTDGYASKLEYPLNENSVLKFADKINSLKEEYFDDHNVYYSVVPDKNYFLAYKRGYPSIDYEKMLKMLNEHIADDIYYIDIFPTLTIEDYYRTDTHWKQEGIFDTAALLLDGLDSSKVHKILTDSDHNVEKNAIEDFFGVYCGQSALSLKPDVINYYTDSVIASAQVWTLDTGEKREIYRIDKLDEGVEFSEGADLKNISLDKYDVFLGGSATIQKITNPVSDTGKRLIIFRDSFGSSIAPLLVHEYNEIILVDIRYISSKLLGDYVDFKDADVLFLYSTPVINSSSMLK
ncbi:MAG: hypothetical protein II312_07265 [Lachnospiraceae bacterium]|nr:hypothetical protein [Lachnospiraceae bacterium]